MANKKVVIEINDLKKYYPASKSTFGKVNQWVKANDGVTFKIYEGETLGLVGESGCGKSTLGRTILKLEEPTAGSIKYDNQDITKFSNKQMRGLRKDISIIFQDPYSSLNPRHTVGQIIGEAVVEHNIVPKSQLNDYILSIMKKCGLSPYMINRYPHQFSGGQRQRIGIARTLALNPRFIVCDEAVSALDVSIQSQIINLLMDLQEEQGFSYLFISHDLSVVKHISDRIGVMYLGNLVELASADEIYNNPKHPYTKILLSSIPSITEINKDRIIIEGDIPSNVNPPSGCKFHTRCPHATDICKSEIPKWEDTGTEHYVACHHHEDI
ncbi:MAG: ABC transporter ATP-binding protein [Bacilli bacterium]